jgi:hypothetical protein
MTARPTLPEPIVVHRSFKDRSRKNIITHTLKTWTTPSGTTLNLYDLRLYVTNKAGIDVPTQRGLTMSVRRLRDLIEGLTKTLREAEALDLIDGDDDEAAAP